MARKSFGLVALAIMLAFGLSFTSCATYATRNAQGATPLGALTPAGAIQDGRTVIAEYSIILGLLTTGYQEFLRATAGREFDIVTRSMLFTTRVKAVERDTRN